MNGYDFTERVRRVLALAREEAARLHHEYVDTEHLLLGIIREGESIAGTVLESFAVDMKELGRTIEARVKKGRSTHVAGSDLPYSSRGKKVLEYAMAEARALNQSYVGTEHLLLGLLREEKAIAALVLVDAGLTLDAARAETLRILNTAMPPGAHRQVHTFHTIRAQLPADADNPPRLFARLRRVIADAHRVAANRNATSVSPAHLAIALLQHGGGMANVVLDKLRLDRPSAMRSLYAHAPLVAAVTGSKPMMGLNPDGVAVLQATEAVQRKAGASFAGTQHLLIALLTTSAEIATVFSAQDVLIDDVRDAIRAVSG